MADCWMDCGLLQSARLSILKFSRARVPARALVASSSSEEARILRRLGAGEPSLGMGRFGLDSDSHGSFLAMLVKGSCGTRDA